MASTSLQQWDLSPEPDLHPLYPSLTHIASLLSSNSGLDPNQRAELVAHCLSRACAFGELIILQYLLSDTHAQLYVDLGWHDEEGLGLVSHAIHGFGAESDRDVEREECVRLLIAQGADLGADKGKYQFMRLFYGWTPLHHAALLSPPTLVSHLMTHGCSPFAITRRGLTPLDVVTAHSILPGRNDVALLLEESMRGQGWTGGKMDEKRRLSEQRERRKSRRKDVRKNITHILSLHSSWWDETDSDSESEDETDGEDDHIYTPLPDYSSMLVFSPPALPHIFDSLITNYKPSLRDATPANTLYLLVRFACLNCDHTWLEDLIIGATDTIEETFFSRAEDLTCLVFWLYNTTVWLHLLQCDTSINEGCEMLGSFDLIEEVINSVFERRIDQLFDAAFLDFSPQGTDFEDVQFESDWSFLRPFSGKKKVPASSVSAKTLSRARAPSSPPTPSQPFSSSLSHGQIPSSSSKFSSLRQTFSRPSRSVQIGMNLAILEEWIEQAGLPPGIQAHFLPVRDLLNWLQSLSSITEFPDLVATIQTLKNINPLQMRRAVRDYKYEVNEGRMNDECVQYLTQLQKDWERHRVKLGVEALRKEMVEKDREDSVSSYVAESSSGQLGQTPSIHTNSSETPSPHNIDMLFGTPEEAQSWEPIKAPPTLGELLDSRFMLPLLFPSDPRLLAAVPRRGPFRHEDKNSAVRYVAWRFRNKKLREVDVGALRWVDGVRSAARWAMTIAQNDDDAFPPAYTANEGDDDQDPDSRTDLQATPLTRQPSARKGRYSNIIGEAAVYESRPGLGLEAVQIVDNINCCGLQRRVALTLLLPSATLRSSGFCRIPKMIIPPVDDKKQPPDYYGYSDYELTDQHHSSPSQVNPHSPNDIVDPYDATSRPPFFREPDNEDITLQASDDYNYHSSHSSRHVDDSQASLVHHAADLSRSSQYQDMEYGEPQLADTDRSMDKKAPLVSFLAQGKYPMEQRIEDKKRGIGRQRYPFVG
ncbi:hypothetical protein H0H92_007015 [Tricholoma furcatifolium]|nr:hypothetical protein H0H92_007015 [Tricholoma furcatifolium]